MCVEQHGSGLPTQISATDNIPYKEKIIQGHQLTHTIMTVAMLLCYSKWMTHNYFDIYNLCTEETEPIPE